MDYKSILSDLNNKIYKPVYFLMGDEPYFIDRIIDYILENVLQENEKAFNQTIVYGKDTTVTNVIEASRRFPMMSNYQVVVVREAHELKKIEDLVHYVEKPMKSTILVIDYRYKKLDKRKKFTKIVNEKGVVFESAKLYDNKIPAWIVGYLKLKNVSIQNDSATLLNEYLGNDLSKISNELDKLILTLPSDRRNITSEDIEKNIGISKDYNVFELQKALGQKDILKANRIINHFGKNQKDNPFVMVVISLYNYYSKIFKYHFLPNKQDNRGVASELGVNPYFVKDYQQAAQNYSRRKLVDVIATLKEFDLRSKGVDGGTHSPEHMLKEMIYRIMH